MEPSVVLKDRFLCSITEIRRKTTGIFYPDEEEMQRMPPPPKGVMGVTLLLSGVWKLRKC